MKSIVMELSNGYFEIARGDAFSADGGGAPFLCYAENGIWHVICSPDGGAAYDAKITIPRGFKAEDIMITLKDGSLSACELDAGMARLDLAAASGSFAAVRARRVNISLRRGSAVVSAAPSVGMEINCGYGELTVNLARSDRGYRYSCERGSGGIIIGSEAVGRRYEGGEPDGVPIGIRCGLGNVSICHS